MSRFQLAWAILMFIGVPAMTLMIALAPFKVPRRREPAPVSGRGGDRALSDLPSRCISRRSSPGCADILLSPGGVARYGGPARFLAGAAVEIVFSFLLGAVTTFRLAVFMIGLAFGRSVVWNGQARDARGVAWRTAIAELWAPFLFGVAVCGALALLLARGPAVEPAADRSATSSPSPSR